ncbi:hypothetical protein DPMN_125350 [Dreissena polymorpha]|uniref:Uncharacterized protein n=1 Tax=Dreissena polymorpha TaxID=45954 RepID=A0A9D4GXC1_DREPO|nr:hypothetical protein DPMN_125350 [Dreissena polymorpha]
MGALSGTMGALVAPVRFACSGWRSSLEIGPPRPPDMQIRLASPRKTAGEKRNIGRPLEQCVRLPSQHWK